MNRAYLPIGLRAFVSLAAAAAPIAATVAAREHVGPKILAAGFLAGAAAWQRWHPSASLSALWGQEADATVAPTALARTVPPPVEGEETP